MRLATEPRRQNTISRGVAVLISSFVRSAEGRFSLAQVKTPPAAVGATGADAALLAETPQVGVMRRGLVITCSAPAAVT